MRTPALLLASCCLALPAAAHDSWLVQDKGALVLVTGDRYPVGETRTPVSRSRCQGGTCWAAIPEHEITIADDRVAVYLREIRPPQALVDRWAQLRESGVAWKERYTKYARIELGGKPAKPLGLPLEIVPEGDGFRVYANRVPVAGLSVELVSERSRFGVWSVSDGEGRLKIAPPFGGRWLLRATLLEPDGDEGWKSRFVTLAFRQPGP